MTPGQFILIGIIVIIWTWVGSNILEDMPQETPRGMKAIFYCFAMGPLIGTLMAGVIFWEMGFGKDKESRKKEEQRQYEGDAILKKIQHAMDNPTWQFDVDGVWLPRDEAIKKIISNYFRK